MTEKTALTGLGDVGSAFRVYMGNRPDYADLPHLEGIREVGNGEIEDIGKQCGNGWRKVFNVYAKLVFALKAELHSSLKDCASWQHWRDGYLLKEQSNSILLFSKPDLRQIEPGKIQILMGKGWAKECGLEPHLRWLNSDFAVSERHNVIVCPYFDYRQLSNQKIVYLCDLIKTMWAKHVYEEPLF